MRFVYLVVAGNGLPMTSRQGNQSYSVEVKNQKMMKEKKAQIARKPCLLVSAVM